ncbi:MAG TPA: phenylalanine--tRNA ligase subunit alpha [Candidatus Binatia bacterium]|nr:phenylalanine--tRNA ligase subunit alpha [Candidatus Binatia bacterium]
MNYSNSQIAKTAELLKQRLPDLANRADILKAIELKALLEQVKTLPAEERANFGKEANALKAELAQMVADHQSGALALPALDVTAPWDINETVSKRPKLLPAENGSQHPLTTELEIILDIFYRMGFTAVESREIDDDYHMFTSLNFPEGHPARDDYDTFTTVQTDKKGKPLIAPAHTSTMQNRVLKAYKDKLYKDQAIAVILPGRVFRNEDLDARHEHTFYQFEGVYVGKQVHTGMLIATLKAFLESYFKKDLSVKIQPFYFPFTEPSLEFAASCIFCDQKGCNICSYTGWIELGGCGMIHPNVLKEAEIDPKEYTGFAWGFGIERLVMLKYGIEDIRHFESGNLNFLRQFS